MSFVMIGRRYTKSEAAKVADLIRRNGREAQVRKAERKSERRVAVRLKRGESSLALEKELEKKVRAMFNLGMRSKEQRAAAQESASETRLHKKLSQKLAAMNAGFKNQILRDFILKPKHYRKQKVEDCPRRAAMVRIPMGVSEGGYTLDADSKKVSFSLGVVVSKNIALEAIQRYQNYEGFSMRVLGDSVFLKVSFETTVEELSDPFCFEPLADFNYGTFKPDTPVKTSRK